jgi:patatin-like phospholipase/acyl hydrolase
MDHSRPFRILSIDGGGVRGIIPARFLQALEEMSQQPIHALFDLIVGTSTGGLIALGLTCLNQQRQGPQYGAKDIVDFYLKESANIRQKLLLVFPRLYSVIWCLF